MEEGGDAVMVSGGEEEGGQDASGKGLGVQDVGGGFSDVGGGGDVAFLGGVVDVWVGVVVGDGITVEISTYT